VKFGFSWIPFLSLLVIVNYIEFKLIVKGSMKYVAANQLIPPLTVHIPEIENGPGKRYDTMSLSINRISVHSRMLVGTNVIAAFLCRADGTA
jgi:hypothetical protein